MIRNRRLRLWPLLLLGLIAGPLTAAEVPSLADRVAAGALPPMQARLPDNPRVLEFTRAYQSRGTSGGEITVLMGRSQDVRIMTVYGYSRLVVYDLDYNIVPDILEKFEVDEGRIFTFHLRKGHRWSDGHPFTAEDFRYFWEDIATNEELSKYGLPPALVLDGEPPSFEVIDETTVRYTWSKPNPFFLPALAEARPEYIFAPAHYLKQFHARYSDGKALQQLADSEGKRNWASVHIDRNRPYKNTNIELPSLDPWINTTDLPAQRFVFERNAYFHRVDDAGMQLPYLDRVIMHIADAKLIPAKTGAGESDLQARNINFSDYTFLKESESRTHNKLLLWDTTTGSHIALYPNLNVDDPVWRTLVRDVRFRHALSLAINRQEINQAIYYGLAREGNDTVYPESPLYKPMYTTAWAEYDLKKANSLLDEIGLTERNNNGTRLLPDGRAAEIIVETAGESTEQVDVLQLVAETWRKAGIRLFIKPLQREVFRNRVYAGQTLMGVWGGIENGMPTADMSPAELAPTGQDQYQWPMWGQYYETGGKVGEPPDLPAAKELLELYQAWAASTNIAARRKIWSKMLDIRAEQTFTIGIVAGVPQPVVMNKRLRNLPEKGVYSWDPGAHFGVYRPDSFWLAK
ncbi:MAG: ABC transporter substrate-binding protein [Gammaproteobacteria bacterium]|nr:ABC transporter substrate-binding protein [Gammaproteobacteria bacterium]